MSIKKSLQIEKGITYTGNETLLEISRIIRSSLGLVDKFKVVHAYLSYLIDFDLGGYYFIEENDFNLKKAINSEEEDYITALGRDTPKNYLLEKIKATRKPCILTQITSTDLKKQPFYRDILLPNEITFVMGAPVIVGGNFLGCIIVGRQENRGDFTGEELNLLELVANMLATGVQSCYRIYRQEDYVGSSEECDPGLMKNIIETNDRSAGWMDILGNMTSGLAREIRNPLANMKMAFYSLARNVSGNPGVQPDLEQVERSLQRMDKAIDFLLSLSSDLDLNLVQVDINRLLDEVLELVGCTLDPEILINRNYSYLPPVVVDREKMITVLSNIIENAVDAMPAGGALHITTVNQDNLARVIIEDSGMGVDRKVRFCLFDPFVSAKPQSTGLGLTICKKIVEAHRGKITVLSNTGKGTTVYLNLPVYQGKSD